MILQAPRSNDANAETRAAVAEWAAAKGFPTIDIAGAWAKSGQDTEQLLLDGLHPNQRGARLWADTVETALRAVS